MAGACNTRGEMRDVYKILVGKPEDGDRPGDPTVWVGLIWLTASPAAGS